MVTYRHLQELQEQMESVFESLAEKEERQEHAKAVSAIDIDAFHCQKVRAGACTGGRG